MKLSKLQAIIYHDAAKKGLWDNQIGAPEAIALINAEVAEAFDAWNSGDDDLFQEELADIIIMVLSVAGTFGIDMESEVMHKVEINELRERSQKRRV